MEDLEIESHEEATPRYAEEVVTRDYAAVLGVNEGVADLLNYTNDLAAKTGVTRPEIEEIKTAVREGNTERVKTLLEGVEAALG